MWTFHNRLLRQRCELPIVDCGFYVAYVSTTYTVVFTPSCHSTASSSGSGSVLLL
eukprot:m.10124 g.10124  ORF g.10124 m.10124 type:complete len:55 (+) comp8134_c0_seq1:1075-1239(+)